MNRKKVISKKSPEKKKVISNSTKTPEKKNPTEVSDATLNINSASVRSKLDFYNPPVEEENTDENEIQVRRLQSDLLI